MSRVSLDKKHLNSIDLPCRYVKIRLIIIICRKNCTSTVASRGFSVLTLCFRVRAVGGTYTSQPGHAGQPPGQCRAGVADVGLTLPRRLPALHVCWLLYCVPPVDSALSTFFLSLLHVLLWGEEERLREPPRGIPPGAENCPNKLKKKIRVKRCHDNTLTPDPFGPGAAAVSFDCWSLCKKPTSYQTRLSAFFFVVVWMRLWWRSPYYIAIHMRINKIIPDIVAKTIHL